MELNVSVPGSVAVCYNAALAGDLHEGIWDGHGPNDHDIHAQGHNNDTLVEAHELVIFGKAIADEIRFDGLQEVPVEQSIHEQV